MNDTRLDNMEGTINSIAQKPDGVTKSVGDSLELVRTGFREMRAQWETRFKEADLKWEAVHDEMRQGFAQIERRFDRLEDRLFREPGRERHSVTNR